MIFFHIAAALLLLDRGRAEDSYDIIIVGGGTSGLALANRISAEYFGLTVAVIEAGGDERGNKNVSDSNIWSKALNTRVDWQYQTVPQAGVNNKTFTLAAGRGIGGTSLITSLNYIRADKAEIDAWKTLGSDGWTWDALFPHYISTTDLTRPSTDQQTAAGINFDGANYGQDGPLKLGFPYYLDNGSFYGLGRDTFAKLGIPEVHDFNGGSLRGFGVQPKMVDLAANVREDAGRAFYWPVSSRSNLQMIKGTVTRLIWADDKAKDGEFVAGAVEYVDDNKAICTIKAKKEVVLSAGVFRSPVILELSGVGNPSILGKAGIASRINLPGVGENLQDQPAVRQFYTSNVNNSGNALSLAYGTAQDIFGTDTAAVAASVQADIPSWAAAASERTGGAVPAAAYQTVFGVQYDLVFNKNVTMAEFFGFGEGSSVNSLTWPLLPFSRGCVHLWSADVADINKPYIDYAFFEVDFDMQTLLAQYKFLWKYWQTEPMASIHAVSTLPAAPYPASDQEWVAFLRNDAGPNSHPIGSAAMMARDLGGVVDGQFKVYGTRNVRVVDASVMPLQLSGHPQATLYAMADRAAHFILGID